MYKSINRYPQILSDTYVCLNIETILYALFADHVMDEKFCFTLNDIESIRGRFVNAGRPLVHYAFKMYDVDTYLSQLGFIDYCKGGYEVNLKELTTFRPTAEEKAFYQNDEYKLRMFHLSCILNIDFWKLSQYNDLAIVSRVRALY